MSGISGEIETRLYKLFNSFYSIYRHNYRKFVDIFLRAYERDTRGLSPIDELLVKELINVIEILRAVKIDTLHELERFIQSHRADYRYVYVIDCLGLPEIYALWCKASETGFVVLMKVFINQEASTRAFKEVFTSKTMLDVARKIDGFVFKRLDTLLHYSETSRVQSRNEFLSAIVKRMEYAITLIPLAGSNIMILSDHGYDVVRVNSKYIAVHTHTPGARLRLAKLAPVILLKQVH